MKPRLNLRRSAAALIGVALAATLVATLPARADEAARHYAIDHAHSSVDAKVAFLGLASKTARFPDMAGSLALAPDDYETVSMAVDVDARTLTTGDAQTAILRGRQFFDVAHYPTVRFAAERLQLTGDRTGVVTGQITARGITRPATLTIGFSAPPFTTAPDQPLNIVATTTIDRRKFGMTAFPLVVGNAVKITIRARLVPQ